MYDLAPVPDTLADLLSEPKREGDFAAFLGGGTRNTDLTRLAGFLRRAGQVSEADLAKYLYAINSAAPNPMTAKEVQGIAQSVSTYKTLPFDLLDEVHLSHAIAAEISDEFRYCSGSGWSFYAGRHWQYDTGAKFVQERIKTFLKVLFEAVKSRNLATDAKLVEAIKACLTAKKIKNLIFLVSSDPAVLIDQSAFDSKPGLLNLRNGTIEFGTGEIVFREHRAEDYLTKIADVNYDKDAQAPLFSSVLSEALDHELGAFVMRFMGYTMTGYADQRVYAIFYGRGANGKSTVVNIVQKILGGYTVNVEPATFLQARSGQVRGDLARLRGARMAVSSEFGVGQVMDAPLVKQLVGGDMITARHLYQSEFEFKPTVVPIFVTNALPVINGGDEALATRTVVVPFVNIIPPEARDPQLPEKLWEERSGILNLLLAGMMDYLSEGKLRCPKAVTEAVDAYIKDSDLLAQFLDERCAQKAGETVGANDLYFAYKWWCSDHGVRSMTQPVFRTELLKKPGMRQERRSGGMRWIDLTLKETNLV